MALDRPKEAFMALARGAVPGIDYKTLYRARVLRQHPNLRRVDVQPDDARLPTMTNIPLRVGIPGLELDIPVGHYVLVGWERLDLPYATLWEPGTQGVVPRRTTLHSVLVELGGRANPVTGGFVHGEGKDPYTGLPYWMLGVTSDTVKGKK